MKKKNKSCKECAELKKEIAELKEKSRQPVICPGPHYPAFVYQERPAYLYQQRPRFWEPPFVVTCQSGTPF